MASAMHAMVDKASWVPDPCVADCEKCHKRFNQYRRKHHCRNCGHVFCWECSGLKYDLLVPAKKGGYEKGTRKVRVCEACFDTLSDIAATGANAMGGAGPSPMRQVRPCYLRPSPHAAADALLLSPAASRRITQASYPSVLSAPAPTPARNRCGAGAQQ
jgi:hypothetical protein